VAVRGWDHRWMADDGFINLRIVGETLAGRPLQFNPGERVEAGTSALWVLLLAALEVTLGWAIELEWLAVLAGLVLTVSGLAAGVLGARRLMIRAGFTGSVLLPAGVLAFAVLPPVWDFATSGLETGLGFAWLGGCFALLAARDARPDAGARITPVILGLGPLIRPDFALFTAAFVGLHCHLSCPGRRERLQAIGWAALAPGLYQVFRMGWFGSLVPNTALTKEATRPYVGRGLHYLGDLMSTYALALPLAVLAMWGLATAVTAGRRGAHGQLVTGAIVVAAGAVHMGYVVWVGGDFMHGRLLLPGLFAVLLPVFVLPVLPRAPLVTVTAMAVLTVWALVCATGLRVDYPEPGTDPNQHITNERPFWLRTVERTDANVTLADNAAYAQVGRGRAARQAQERGESRFLGLYGPTPLLPGSGVILEGATIGMLAAAAGPDVVVIDRWSLADAIHARLTMTARGKAGHEKVSGAEWVVARLPVGDAPVPGADPANVADVRRAFECPALRKLRAAVTEPMTPARFLRNIIDSPALTKLRIPAEPAVAAECGY
jgi:arabinofuranosyltransferase